MRKSAAKHEALGRGDGQTNFTVGKIREFPSADEFSVGEVGAELFLLV